ncbi:hypothetical protein JYU34_009396 [Plutella xylostella]|uniref:Uncharacterized protein n=1 Tax=Plutella xylostella TaxID=51655 RepID=A0ABQ7QJI9_PLUXY|nr:hypothetical protein JYU34_009396 [Plutella xylostella]
MYVLSSRHTNVSCGGGALAWFLRLGGGGGATRRYPGAVTSLVANEYVAALFDGRVLLHEVSDIASTQAAQK